MITVLPDRSSTLCDASKRILRITDRTEQRVDVVRLTIRAKQVYPSYPFSRMGNLRGQLQPLFSMNNISSQYPDM